VLAHKPINKFIRGIFHVNLKLRSIKKIKQNISGATRVCWKIGGDLL